MEARLHGLKVEGTVFIRKLNSLEWGRGWSGDHAAFARVVEISVAWAFDPSIPGILINNAG